MDAEQISAVFEIYVQRMRQMGIIVNLDNEERAKAAQHFLFSDTPLDNVKELQQSLDHVAYIYDQFQKCSPVVFAEEFPHEARKPSLLEIKRHCMAMIPKMEGFLAEGSSEAHMEKCLRWLGFIWGCGIFSNTSSLSVVAMRGQIAKILEHRHYYAEQGRTDLTHALLGMVQGMLWSSGMYSLDELKDHNKS